MIIAEIRREAPPTFSEFTKPAFIRLSVIMAYRWGMPNPKDIPECVSLWRQTCDELLTFETWTEAEAWATTADRPDRPVLLAALNRSRAPHSPATADNCGQRHNQTTSIVINQTKEI